MKILLKSHGINHFFHQFTVSLVFPQRSPGALGTPTGQARVPSEGGGVRAPAPGGVAARLGEGHGRMVSSWWPHGDLMG